MKKKTKNRLLNVVLVVLVAAMACAAVLAVGNRKGWFSQKGEMTVSSVSGSVFLQRDGVSYSLRTDTALKSGDDVETEGGASAVIAFRDGGTLTLDERTELSFPDGAALSAEVLSGEVFAETGQQGETLTLTAAGLTAEATDAVLAVSAEDGSASVSVFAGSVDLSSGVTVKAGDAATLAPDGTVSVSALEAPSLDDFLTGLLRTAGESRELCFTEEQLDEAGADAKQTEQTTAASESTDTAAETEPAAGTETTAGDRDTAAETTAAASENAENTDTAAPQETEAAHTCTVSIVCSEILDHMSDLKGEKASLVPASGVILSGADISFSEGETAFDALKRACDSCGIQLEYSWSPVYGTAYIEGINNLYEFDCGSSSGWLYEVNGKTPDYGCSGYKLSDGDTIVFRYTCG